MKIEFDLQGEGGNIIWVMYKVKNILEYIGADEAIKPYVDQVTLSGSYGEAVNWDILIPILTQLIGILRS